MKTGKMIVLAVFVVALVVVAGPRPASAQSNPVLFRAPFDFIAGDRVLPAGSYRIVQAGVEPTVLRVENTQRPTDSAYVLTDSTAVPASGDVQVQFKNIDGHMFLWRVAVPGDTSRELGLTRTEAERVLARLNLMPAEPAVEVGVK